jgi:hypothetical protein
MHIRTALTSIAVVLLSCITKSSCRHESELKDNNYWLGLLTRMYMHTCQLLALSALVLLSCVTQTFFQARVGAKGQQLLAWPADLHVHAHVSTY